MINLGVRIDRVRYRQQPVLQLQALRRGQPQHPGAQLAYPPSAPLTNALLEHSILVRYAHTHQGRWPPRPPVRISEPHRRKPCPYFLTRLCSLYRDNSSLSQISLAVGLLPWHLTWYGFPLTLLFAAANRMKSSASPIKFFLSR